jgi:chloramphenicol O-acetyltransferase type A
MKKIDLETYKRRGMFEAFKDREIPYLATTGNVDVTHLKRFVDEQRCGFFVSISFLISKAVNSVPELRHRIINGELFEFGRVDPGFTVLLDDETFSFCDSRHFEAFEEYRQYANARIQEVREKPDLGTGEKNHMFFITSTPWFSFTSIVHPYTRQYGSIPIVTIGKYFGQGDRFLAPIGIQAHHGVVDGIHVGKFYGHLSDMCQCPEKWLV